MTPTRAWPLICGLTFAMTAAAPPVDDHVLMPGIVSTSAAEVRIAYRPDGRQIVWGSIGRSRSHDQQDVWEMHRVGSTWSRPARATFDTDAVEFDPAFSPDGRQLYFDSDRPGGYGGTDIYVVDVDVKANRFSQPRNLGRRVNSRGDEWAAAPTLQHRLIFSSDGWGGAGRHDLFEASLGARADPPRNLGPNVNGSQEDFDPAISLDGQTMVFSSGTMDDPDAHVALFMTHKKGAGWDRAVPLARGCSAVVIGASLPPHRPDVLDYSANCPDGKGRMDIHETSLPHGSPEIG